MNELTAHAIEQAATRLHAVAFRTPALSSSLSLYHAAGWPVVVKAESLQRTGSFKFRGAYNHAASLPAAERAPGLIGASSGNHAQALALAGQLLEVPVTVVIPDDAPAPKVEGVSALGAEIVTYSRDGGNRDALVAELAARDRLSIVPSANSLWVMAGAGTVALELLTDHPEITTLVVPVGGGGLAAGSAVIAKHLVPGIRVYGVEPEAGADTMLSLRCNQRIALPDTPATIADGLGHTTPAPLSWNINSRHLNGVLTVSDDDIKNAMAFAFRHLKVVAEPSGAVGLAAILAGQVPHDSGTIGVVISGGNVDLAVFHRLIQTIPLSKEPVRA